MIGENILQASNVPELPQDNAGTIDGITHIKIGAVHFVRPECKPKSKAANTRNECCTFLRLWPQDPVFVCSKLCGVTVGCTNWMVENKNCSLMRDNCHEKPVPTRSATAGNKQCSIGTIL